MSEAFTVRDLRRRWKPHKERLGGSSTNIRFHRACSWLQQVEQLNKDASDFAILAQWIAFNALYGQWDDARREPQRDQACWQAFIARMLRLDQDDRLESMLVENKPLVLRILEDEYLNKYFWEEPCEKRARQSRNSKHKARNWYLEGNWTMIIDQLLGRIYLLRCQLMHGAATYNSKLNRTAIKHCSMMMNHLMQAFLLVWSDHGSDEDWGTMCYPPMTVVMQPSN